MSEDQAKKRTEEELVGASLPTCAQVLQPPPPPATYRGHHGLWPCNVHRVSDRASPSQIPALSLNVFVTSCKVACGGALRKMIHGGQVSVIFESRASIFCFVISDSAFSMGSMHGQLHNLPSPSFRHPEFRRQPPWQSPQHFQRIRARVLCSSPAGKTQIL